MALRAGYYGLKTKILNKVNKWDQIVFTRSEQAVVGSVNLLPLTIANVKALHASGGTWNGNTFTKSGDNTTFACDVDGFGNVKSITINTVGALASDISFKVCGDVPALYGKHLKMVGCPAGGSSSKYRMLAYRIETSDGSGGSVYDYGDGIEFDYLNTTGSVYVAFTLKAGITAVNLVFKPMFTVDMNADYSDFVTYAMTNQELTASAADQKTAINAIITAATEATDFAAFKAAMEAITPVTRSLSMVAAPEEIVKDEIEEPVVEKKTTRKKSTAKAETQEEV